MIQRLNTGQLRETKDSWGKMRLFLPTSSSGEADMNSCGHLMRHCRSSSLRGVLVFVPNGFMESKGKFHFLVWVDVQRIRRDEHVGKDKSGYQAHWRGTNALWRTCRLFKFSLWTVSLWSTIGLELESDRVRSLLFYQTDLRTCDSYKWQKCPHTSDDSEHLTPRWEVFSWQSGDHVLTNQTWNKECVFLPQPADLYDWGVQ